MDPVSIDNGLFVGGLSKKSKLATVSMLSLIKRSSKPSQFCGESAARAVQRLLFGEAKVHKSRIFNGVKKHLAAGNSDPQRRRRIFFQ